MAINREILIESGVGYDEGVEKFLGEKELYDSLLVNFLEDNDFEEAKSCFEKEDYDGVERAIHTMKSVTGTLCMNELYPKCCEVLGLVREKQFDKAKPVFDEAYKMYKVIYDAIDAGRE